RFLSKAAPQTTVHPSHTQEATSPLEELLSWVTDVSRSWTATSTGICGHFRQSSCYNAQC
ncbi:hypothetical protein NDU88_004284, partial [Pleurodeles waltl]